MVLVIASSLSFPERGALSCTEDEVKKNVCANLIVMQQTRMVHRSTLNLVHF